MHADCSLQNVSRQVEVARITDIVRKHPSWRLQASSLGFDGKPAQKRAFPDANGDSRASVDRVDYSSFAQQKRSSIELGMGNISHTANINPSRSFQAFRTCIQVPAMIFASGCIV